MAATQPKREGRVFGRIAHVAFIAIALALLTAAAFAAEQPVLTTTGPLAAAKLVAIAADGSLTLETGGQKQTLAPNKLVTFGKLRESDRGPLVLLADGSWLVGDLVGLTADECRIDSRLLGELPVPRSIIRGVILRVPPDRLARDKLIERIISRQEPRDLLLLANGDELTGQIVEQKYDMEKSEDFLLLAPAKDKEPAAIALAKVAALAFDSLLVESPPPRGPHAIAGLRDGSRLVVASIAIKAGRTELLLASGLKVRIDNDELEDVITFWQPLGHGVTYLSDLRNPSYKHIPFLTLAWPYGVDQNDLQGSLRSGGNLYAKGLGMHSTARLGFDLAEPYRQFAAEIVLDDAAGERGSAIFRVFTARPGESFKPAYESPVVRGGDAPRAITVDLQGVDRLALIVDYSERGDEQDHANWLNARLIK